MEENLKQELMSRCVYDNVVSKYLDDLDRQIEEENRRTETGIEKAMRYLQAAELNVNPAFPVYALIQTSLGQVSILNETPPSFPHMNSVFPLQFSHGLTKLQLTKLKISTEPQDSFNNLAYYQYSLIRQNFLKLFLNSCKSWHKDKLILSLLLNNSIQKSIQPQTFSENMLENSSVWKSLNLKPDLDTIKEKLAPNSAVLILQYSLDLADIYAGFLHVDKEKTAKYWFRSRKVDTWEQEKLENLMEKFESLKYYLQKTPVNDESGMEGLIRDGVAKFEDIVSELGSLGLWLEGLSEIISPPIPVEVVEENPKKKAPPPAKGKAAADDKSADAGLPLPSSGISTLYLCLDQRFMSLPWETLPFLSVVPLISRDFSLINLENRISSSSNLTKDTLKYSIERSLDLKAKEMSDKISQDFTTAKFEGIRQADPGQWEKLCSESSLFINIMTEGIEEQTVTSLSYSPICKCIVNLDRFIVLKKYLKKTKLREKPSFELLSMIGCPSIVGNTFPIPNTTALEFTSGLYKSLATNSSLAGGLYKYKNDTQNLLYKFGIVQYGVPYLRIQ